MQDINITELRILPPLYVSQEAKNALRHLREICTVGDVTSPIHEEWTIEQ